MAEEVAGRLRDRLLEVADEIEATVSDPFVDVNSSNIEDLLSKKKILVLFFTAEWCGPCISMQDHLREIAAKIIDSRVAFGRVDVDKSYSIADRYSVQHIPSVIVLVDGKVADVIVGSTTREKLETRIKSVIEEALKF